MSVEAKWENLNMRFSRRSGTSGPCHSRGSWRGMVLSIRVAGKPDRLTEQIGRLGDMGSHNWTKSENVEQMSAKPATVTPE